MASITKRCRHAREEWERCRCAWLIRYRQDGRTHYIRVGPDRDEAVRRLAIHRSPEAPLREVARAPGLVLPKQEGESWVYFITGAGLTKIGRTRDLEERLCVLQVSSPVALTLILVIEGGREMERKIHEQFALYRRHGEWFALPVGWENEARFFPITFWDAITGQSERESWAEWRERRRAEA